MTFSPSDNGSHSNAHPAHQLQNDTAIARVVNAKRKANVDPKPANRELDRALGIRRPQPVRRTEEEKRKSITVKMIQEALTVKQLAEVLRIAAKTLQNRLSDKENGDYPEYVRVPGSKAKLFPKDWIDEWLQNTWIHGTVTKVRI